MKFLPEAIRQQLPPLYSQEHVKDPLVICKFFYPDFAWRWYAIEFDGQDLFFGFVTGDVPEFGYFSLTELKENRGQLGCPIERDFSFQPCRLSALQVNLKR
jgi:hypothetical protein